MSNKERLYCPLHENCRFYREWIKEKDRLKVLYEKGIPGNVIEEWGNTSIYECHARKHKSEKDPNIPGCALIKILNQNENIKEHLDSLTMDMHKIKKNLPGYTED